MAAIRCAQLGLSVATVEDDRPGGVCLNWGCIPTKALLAQRRGGRPLPARPGVRHHGGRVEGRLRAGGAALAARSPTAWPRASSSCSARTRSRSSPGRHAEEPRGTVEVHGQGRRRRRSRRAGRSSSPPAPSPASLPGVDASTRSGSSPPTGAVTRREPARLARGHRGRRGRHRVRRRLRGLRRLRSRCSRRCRGCCPIEDEEVSAQIARLFPRRGITIRTGVQGQVGHAGAAAVAVAVEAEGKTETFEADQVLMAVGRAAAHRGLGLEALGVATREGLRDGLVHHGDLGEGHLRHRRHGRPPAAGAQGAWPRAWSPPRRIAGQHAAAGRLRQRALLHLLPTAGRVDRADARRGRARGGREVAVGKFPFTASGKAVALGETEGFVKVVADKSTARSSACTSSAPRPPS